VVAVACSPYCPQALSISPPPAALHPQQILDVGGRGSYRREAAYEEKGGWRSGVYVAATVVTAATAAPSSASGRAVAESHEAEASHEMDAFHGLRGRAGIQCGIDGFGGVWAGLKSVVGLTERGDLIGPELKLGRCDPRGLAGIGLPTRTGWG
jgi:hypothetical protein